MHVEAEAIRVSPRRAHGAHCNRRGPGAACCTEYPICGLVSKPEERDLLSAEVQVMSAREA
jgi:hypothetical protein